MSDSDASGEYSSIKLHETRSWTSSYSQPGHSKFLIFGRPHVWQFNNDQQSRFACLHLFVYATTPAIEYHHEIEQQVIETLDSLQEGRNVDIQNGSIAKADSVGGKNVQELKDGFTSGVELRSTVPTGILPQPSGSW